MATKRTIWGIHAGKQGAAEELFLSKAHIALGWDKLGDLSALPDDRRAFREHFMKAQSTEKTRGAGQLYRFVHEMREGDLVVWPSQRDQQIRLGEVVGPYVFRSDIMAAYPHMRAVRWLATGPRAEFAPRALAEVDVPLALLRIKHHIPDFVRSVATDYPVESFRGVDDEDDAEVEAPVAIEEVVAFDEPRILFKEARYDLAGLLHYIDIGDIGLPDIQRPFVWSAAKVRDLFDSMYRGYPVGYLLFWSNAEISREGTRSIGTSEKQHKIPGLLVVDGQQRLTSLYAVFKSQAVMDEEFRASKIEIAFRPRDGRFGVTDAAIRKDPEFIPSISDLWTSGKGSWGLVNDFFKSLEQKRTLSDSDKEIMSRNLDRLFDLQKYPFTALEIAPTVDEESVANIFVRINSEGVKLNQADFILTLLSVFWDEGRSALERFCRSARQPTLPGQPSPFNHFIQPSPDQMLRVAVALGFHRGRLKSVYQLLRGKNLETGKVTPEERDQQFGLLKQAQGDVLDVKHWHLFFGSLLGAGFRSAQMVSSENALLYSYALYLIGRLQCDLEVHALQRLIGRWYFASSLTGRYTSSPETVMESDLNHVKDIRDSAAFVEALERIIASTLTNDFWTIALPGQLEKSASRGPALFAFYAAQCRLEAPALFSDRKIADLLDPATYGKKQALERHHIFPRDWLEDNGVTDLKQVNQLGNFSLIEWPDNISIGATPPSEYVPELKRRFSEPVWDRMCRLHALPSNWETLSYEEFLKQRRVLMAALIRRGFETLSLSSKDDEASIEPTPEEAPAWSLVETVELALRQLVTRRYRGRWGNDVEAQFAQALGTKAIAQLEHHREKHIAQYPLSDHAGTSAMLDYCYLGQLSQLMLHESAWELFRDMFQDRRHLEDLFRAITPVRNDHAHFRTVPSKELQRCKVAADDLLQLIRKHG